MKIIKRLYAFTVYSIWMLIVVLPFELLIALLHPIIRWGQRCMLLISKQELVIDTKKDWWKVNLSVSFKELIIHLTEKLRCNDIYE